MTTYSNEYLYSFEFNTWLDAVHFIAWTKINNKNKINNSLDEWSNVFGYKEYNIFVGNHLQFSGQNYQWKVIVEFTDFAYIDNNDDMYDFRVWDNILQVSNDNSNHNYQ